MFSNPPPPPLKHVPHILRIVIEVTERSHDRALLSNNPVPDQIAHPQPLWMRLHERLANLHACSIPRLQ